MNIHDATEQAYKNGYEHGYADAIAFAKNELKSIKVATEECLQKVKEFVNNVGDKLTPTELLTICKHCAHSDTLQCSVGYVWCDRMCRYMKEDGFCSFGERKTK